MSRYPNKFFVGSEDTTVSLPGNPGVARRQAQCLACAGMARREYTLSQALADKLHEAPWYMTSLVIHMVVLLLLLLFPVETPNGTQGFGLVVTEVDVDETLRFPEDSPVVDDEDMDTDVESLPEEDLLDLTTVEIKAPEELGAIDLEDLARAEADPQLGVGDTLAGTTAGTGVGLFSARRGGQRARLCGTTGGGGTSGSWTAMLRRLRRHGLDVVIVFDSTGSMRNEIETVKQRIGDISCVLLGLVPKARVGLVTYRDQGDAYVVKGQTLTRDVDAMRAFLKDIQAGGGGDAPEAVHEGLKWAMNRNRFRPKARKVILLFGDAPPRPTHERDCLTMAKSFHTLYGGLVSTVQCREAVPAFHRIAFMGEGESYALADHRRIIEQLMVLAFGSRYRQKVLEALALLKAKDPAAAPEAQEGASPWDGIGAGPKITDRF